MWLKDDQVLFNCIFPNGFKMCRQTDHLPDPTSFSSGCLPLSPSQAAPSIYHKPITWFFNPTVF
jgi:hypothetical protein